MRICMTYGQKYEYGTAITDGLLATCELLCELSTNIFVELALLLFVTYTM